MAPSGTFLKDGFATKIEFGQDTDIALWAKEVTPPGIEGGDPIDQTTMENSTYRVRRARQLKELTSGNMTCAYDPKAYSEVMAIVNTEGTIKITFSDGAVTTQDGYLRSFTPNTVQEGEQPTAEVVIEFTNWDATGSAESGVGYTTPAP